MTEAKNKLGNQAKVTSQSSMQCQPGCTGMCDAAAPQGACAKPTVVVTVSGANDEAAAAHYRTAIEVFVGSLRAINDGAANARALVANAKTAVELGIVTSNAVSSGDIASAASVALCILPPLIAAKKNISALRRDLRATRELAKSAGLLLTRPDDDDDDAVAAQARIAPALVAPLTDRDVLNLFAFPEGGLAVKTRAGVIALPGGEMLLRTVPEQRLEWSIGIGTAAPGTAYCAVAAGRRGACLKSRPVFANSKRQGTELLLMDSAAGMLLSLRHGPWFDAGIIW